MQPSTLRDRLDWLRAKGYPVLSLDDGISRMLDGTLPDGATVLTFDDGWRLCFEKALPLLCERGMPATVYVTTYYVEKETPVYGLVVQYLMWLARDSDSEETIDIRRKEQSILASIEGQPIAAQRRTCVQLATDLGLEWNDEKFKEFCLMSSQEVLLASEMPGIDIQLHTRRHRFPENAEVVRNEISDNAADLEDIVKNPLIHFCYPSGEFYPSMFDLLKGLGIVSATTTDPGLNHAQTNIYALNRFVDSDDYSQLEFEAEMSGFAEFLRQAKNTVYSVFALPNTYRRSI